MIKFFKFLIIALVAIIGLDSCSKDCDHDFIEHDYTNDLVGTWSVIGPDHVEAMVIKADGTIEFTISDRGEFYEGTATFELSNNKMTVIWDDGTIDVGRLNVVPEEVFYMVVDEETGAGYYYVYCHEDLSDEIVGSWLVQSDETSEIHSYYADGTSDCQAYYYHLEEQYETFITGTYKVVGDILFDNAVYEGYGMYSFGSRISYIPNGSPFGDIMTSTACTNDDEGEFVESVDSIVRVSKSLNLAGKKYGYSDCRVTNVEGEDIDIEFMGYKFNFAKMDGTGLDIMLKTISFNIEFPSADTLKYSYQYNNNEETFDAPIVVENNKMTVKMSGKVPTLKDVVFYTFQSVDCNHMHLCMDKTSFVNFYTNMQAMLMAATDEQFDITDADAVNAIHNNINNTVKTIKLSIEMKN